MSSARPLRGFRIFSSAEFYLLCADFARRLYLLRVRVYEKAGDDAAFAQTVNGGAHVQAAFRRNLFRIFGHERNGVGFNGERDFYHLFSRGHLNVQVRRNATAQAAQVIVLYVATVCPQVNRDAVGSRLFTDKRCRNDARLRGEPRLTNGCDVIYIDVESCSHKKNVCRIIKVAIRLNESGRGLSLSISSVSFESIV
jgi:hypothetical protein